MRPAFAVVAVLIPVFVGALDLTVVSAVLPAVLVELRVPLKTGLAHGAWTVSGYLVSYAFAIVFMGRLSDRFGRRGAFVAALGLFFAGSAWAAASADEPARWLAALERLWTGSRVDAGLAALHALVVGRVAQALGAGALVPIALAVVTDLYPATRRAALIGLVAGVDTAGWVLGHLWGGLAVQVLPWQFLFWSNLPVIALSAALSWRALRGLAPLDRDAPADWRGAILLALTLGGVTVALGGNDVSLTAALAQPVEPPPYAAPLALLAVAAVPLFVVLERRARSPLVDVRLFAARGTLLVSLANLLVGFAVMVGLVSVPLLVNLVGARTSREGALASGELLAAFTIPLALLALPGGVLAGRIGMRATAAAGLALATLGYALESAWRPETVRAAVALVTGQEGPSADLAPVLGPLVLLGGGLGIATAPLATALLERAPAARRGSTAALVIALRLAGMTLAASALTTYGLRRLSTLAAERLPFGAFADPERVLAATQRIATDVSGEMALLAAAACALALVFAVFGARPPRATSA